MSVTARTQAAGPLRRWGAMVYDVLLLVAVLMVATLPFLPFVGTRVLVPREVGWLAYLYWVWQCGIIVLYFGIPWRAKGATLGMQAWRLRLESVDGAPIEWRDVFARLGMALVPWLPAFVVLTLADVWTMSAQLRTAGLALLSLGFANYLSAYRHTERLAWHERKLRTRVRVRPRDA